MNDKKSDIVPCKKCGGSDIKTYNLTSGDISQYKLSCGGLDCWNMTFIGVAPKSKEDAIAEWNRANSKDGGG